MISTTVGVSGAGAIRSSVGLIFGYPRDALIPFARVEGIEDEYRRSIPRSDGGMSPH